MTGASRQRLPLVAAIVVTLGLHAAMIAGLALMGEWRVWRFITNFIVQVDAVTLIGWIVCTSVAAMRERRP